jgi:hypothetical protein
VLSEYLRYSKYTIQAHYYLSSVSLVTLLHIPLAVRSLMFPLCCHSVAPVNLLQLPLLLAIFRDDSVTQRLVRRVQIF